MAAIILGRDPNERWKRTPDWISHDEKLRCRDAKRQDAAVPQIFSWRKNRFHMRKFAFQVVVLNGFLVESYIR